MTAPTIRRRRTRTAKLVVTGPFDAGKTTLIGTITDSTVLSTERTVTHAGDRGSERTTVAMDFGRLGVDPDMALFLFGTPGQQRFGFMWDILAEGMLGFVLVVDAARPDSIAEAAQLRRRFTGSRSVPHVVAINKVAEDQDHDEMVARVRSELEVEPDIPVLVADARDREDVRQVLLAFLRHVLGQVRARADADREAGEVG